MIEENNQTPTEEQTQPTVSTLPAFTFGPNVQLRPIKGLRLEQTEDSQRLQLALQGKKILVGLDALKARGVRGKAASSYPNVFYGEGLVDENGYLTRDFYNTDDTSDAVSVLANMTPSQRMQWAQEAKRVGLYGEASPSAAISSRGDSFSSTDENVMRMYLFAANQKQQTASAFLQTIKGYATVQTGGGAAPMVTSPEDIGYYLNQASLSMTGKPMTKALAKQLVDQYQQMQRQAAASRVSAPSLGVFAQNAVTQQQPNQVAGGMVGKAIQLAFQALTGR